MVKSDGQIYSRLLSTAAMVMASRVESRQAALPEATLLQAYHGSIQFNTHSTDVVDLIEQPQDLLKSLN